MGSLSATLSACALSPEARPPAKLDPVIEQRTVVKTVCPAEVAAAVPAPIATPEGLVLEASQAVLGWLAAHFAREQLLTKRIEDAKAQCPNG